MFPLASRVVARGVRLHPGGLAVPCGRGRAFAAVSTTNTGSSGSSVYETNLAVHEYLQFHYATAEELLPYACGPKEALDFTARCAVECLAATGRGRALDVGCSVGGATFELSKEFDEVVGVDFSAAFIKAADQMKHDGNAPYRSRVEADIFRELTARVPAGAKPERVSFSEGDACNLPKPSELGSGTEPFDAILASNLLCRLPEPMNFLRALPTLVRPGGVVVLVSPYSWLPEWTPREKWIGGFNDAATGAPSYSFDALAEEMSGSTGQQAFTLEKQGDIPFLIREHARKFQWGCSHLTVWRRIGEK